MVTSAVIILFPILTPISVSALQAVAKPEQREIVADDSPKCRVDYADSYISLDKRSSDVYRFRAKVKSSPWMMIEVLLEDEDDGEVYIEFVKENPLWVSDSGVVMGKTQEKKEKIARLNPFAHLAKTIRRAFEGGMDK
ncbi:hypothetical protein FOZ63_011765, partial [Perkinsus olseni]